VVVVVVVNRKIDVPKNVSPMVNPRRLYCQIFYMK
jgi:hypothetical protein